MKKEITQRDAPCKQEEEVTTIEPVGIDVYE